jgi:8-oxo-dGTP pyrophosphatase MutT (NUDIX family)
MERHFTVSGFVSQGGRTALHWHRLGLWLPPGGHIETNEDPIQAVRREVLEETGIEVDVLGHAPFGHAEPPQLPPPVTIGVYDIERDSGTPRPHQHIDFVYFTRPVTGARLDLPVTDGWAWVDESTLEESTELAPPEGPPAAIPEDVRRLGLAAIAAARDAA